MSFKYRDVYPLNYKRDVYASIKERQGEMISCANIAKDTGIPATTVRWIVEILIRYGYVKKVCMININQYYKRYTYSLVPGKDYLRDNYEDRTWIDAIKKNGGIE